MYRRLGDIGIYVVILLVIYLVINIVHVVWLYTNPEGVWSFFYFLDLLKTTVFVIFIAVVALTFTVSLILTLFSSLKNGAKKTNFTSLIASGIGILAILIFNYFQVMGFSIFFNKKMADKYSYIEQSEDLMEEGKYEEALKTAEALYLEAQQNNKDINPFFILSRLYVQLDMVTQQNLEKRLITTINYAYCLQKTLKSLDKAESLYNESLELINSGELEKKESLRYFPKLYLANLCLSQGRYDEAEGHFSSLLSQNSYIEDEDVVHALGTYVVLTRYAQKTGNLSKAAQLQVDAYNLYENSSMSKKSSTYLVMLLVGTSGEMQLGHLDNAGHMLSIAQKLAYKRDEKAIYLEFLKLKGTYCMMASAEGSGNEAVLDEGLIRKVFNIFSAKKSASEKFAIEGEKCFTELVKENNSRFGKSSLAYAESLTWLASFNSRQSKFNKSQTLYSNALQIFDKTKEDNQEVYYSILLQSLTNSFYNNNHDNLKETIQQVEDFHFKKLSANYLFLTEEEREQYILNAEKSISSINSIYVNLKKDEYKQSLYNNVISVKNIALFSNQSIRRFIGNGQSPLYLEYYNIIKEKESLEALKESANSGLLEASENELKLKEKDILKKILSDSSFEAFNPRSIQWTDIRSSLESNEVAIEIINVPSKPYSKDSIAYFALITKSAFMEPVLVPLCKEEELVQILNKKGGLVKRVNDTYIKDKDALYEILWKPVEKYVSGSSKVYVSVSGLLHKISFPAILIDSKPEIVYLSSTRQVVTRNNTEDSFKVAALFGDIDYDYSGNKKVKPDAESTARLIGSSPGRSTYNRLPYSANEIFEIKNILENTAGNRAELFQDSLASETKLRELSKSDFNILHIATHGFFNQGNNSLVAKNLPLPIGSINKNAGGPLLRSGILLAGANKLSNTGTHNDGILTAQEISKMDLSNLDLVVLSACETGLGEIKGSEGVYGLQRAFKLAGAKSLIVSLWKIPDEQTSELMNYFYNNFTAGISKAESLKKAQLTMRQKYDSPFYWAGFILISE